jgi:hypothetical protein
MDNPETVAKSGTQDTGRRPAKHNNTIQHRKQSRMYNPETLAKSGTQDTGRRRAKHKHTIQHRKQSRMDNPETLAKSGTQDTGQAKHKDTIQHRKQKDVQHHKRGSSQVQVIFASTRRDICTQSYTFLMSKMVPKVDIIHNLAVSISVVNIYK